MDLGISNIVPIIADSTTGYLSTFSPLFLLIGGILLAVGVGFALLSFLTGKKYSVFDEEEV